MLKGDIELLSGWGRTPVTAAYVVRPASLEDAAAAVASVPARGVIARGLGRSYGDAAQNAGGVVISTTRLDRILAVDAARGTARVEAGVSLDRLMRTTLPLGLWPAVTPGTRQVTVGGAIASDVHGKNHHHDGTFCAHVESLVVATPAGGVVTTSPVMDPEVFWATAGGMGLTGLVLEATMHLSRVESGYIRVDTEPHPDLDSLMARMTDTDNRYRYSVAWIDCLARGRSLGRSILELGDHARRDDLPAPARSSSRILDFNPRPRFRAPAWLPSGLLNRISVTAFNELWYRRTRRHREDRFVSLAAFFHPLDAITDFNRIYGRRGFVQYQIVVPDSGYRALHQAIEALGGNGCAASLGVLKRFGPSNPAPLSFPSQGWTLAVDIPAGGAGIGARELSRLLDRLDNSVVDAGGRIYLSKDSRLQAELVPSMYPRLSEWRAVRDRLDPERRLCSDMSRRLWTLLDNDAVRPHPRSTGPARVPG